MATRPYLVEQTIKKQVTISAGATELVQIPIPADVDVALKGYGYTWYTSNTFRLSTGQITLPIRQDQEGSASIPRIFSIPLECRSGGFLELMVTNGDASSHTYDVVFYVLSSSLLEGPSYASTGGELLVGTTSSAAGTQSIIYNSSLTTAANVTAFGLAVDPTPPTTLNDGTLTTASGTAAAIGASTALKRGVLVQAAPSNTANALLGSSGSQNLVLEPGDSEFVDIDNLSKVYVKRESGTNIVINYHGV